MDSDTRRRLVKAARALLQWDQATLAERLGVGVATLKKMEAGYVIGDDTTAAMIARLPKAGVIVIERSSIGGLEVAAGVALLTSAAVGALRPKRSDADPDVPRIPPPPPPVKKAAAPRKARRTPRRKAARSP